jgi:hypothetical protein
MVNEAQKERSAFPDVGSSFDDPDGDGGGSSPADRERDAFNPGGGGGDDDDDGGVPGGFEDDEPTGGGSSEGRTGDDDTVDRDPTDDGGGLTQSPVDTGGGTTGSETQSPAERERSVAEGTQERQRVGEALEESGVDTSNFDVDVTDEGVTVERIGREFGSGGDAAARERQSVGVGLGQEREELPAREREEAAAEGTAEQQRIVEELEQAGVETEGRDVDVTDATYQPEQARTVAEGSGSSDPVDPTAPQTVGDVERQFGGGGTIEAVGETQQPRDTGSAEDFQQFLRDGSVSVAGLTIPVGTDAIDESLSDRYETGAFVEGYTGEEVDTENLPDRQLIGSVDQQFARDFTEEATVSVPATPATTVQSLGVTGIGIGQTANYIVRGDDDQVTQEDFAEATGFQEGASVQEFTESDSIEGADRVGRAEEVTEETADRAVETAEAIQENPAQLGTLAGGLVWSLPASVAASTAISRSVRSASSIRRTAGGTEVDVEDLASDEVVRFQQTGGAEGDRFPGADDPALYQSDPARAVREQSRQQTPESIVNAFDEQDVEGDAFLKKALDVEPEGPGRGAGGFTSTPDETGINPEDITTSQVTDSDAGDFAYENPGAFFSPEVSPYFLRGSGDASFSFRPGVPDTGNRPTGVIARGDVESPGAGTQLEFAQELAEREGEPLFLTKPAGSSQLNVGEAEAVLPAGTDLADIGGGRVRQTLRRFGIGSDFYTRVEGERVPLRLVTPERDRDADVNVDADGVAESTVENPAFRVDSLEDIRRAYEPPTDRPLPAFMSGGAPSESVASGRETTTSASADTPSRRRQERSRIGDVFGGSGSSGGSNRRRSDGTSGFSGGSFSGGSSSGGGGEGGSSSGGGSGTSGGGGGGGGGGTTTGTPTEITTGFLFDPDTPDRPPREFETPEGDSSDDPFGDLFGGAREEDLTDFVDPLTGNILETQG